MPLSGNLRTSTSNLPLRGLFFQLEMRKAPLNALENPVYPDIRRAPPRRRFVKPKWTVDADREATEAALDNPELYAHAILERDYSESKFKYGRMNPDHTLIVNEGFRPPPDDIEDYLPLSRMKVGVTGARTNPGGGYYKAQNTSLAEVNSYLTDRLKSATSAPTIEIKIGSSLPQGLALGDRLPEDVLPVYSSSSGGKYRAVSANLAVRQMELEEKTPRTGATSGYRTHLTPSEDYDRPLDLEETLPAYSVDAGQASRGLWRPGDHAPVELEDGLHTSANAGHATVALYRGEGYERVRTVDRVGHSSDSGKAYRRRDEVAPSHHIRVVDRPTTSLRANTTYLKEGFRPLDVEPLASKPSIGPQESGVRVVTASPEVRVRVLGTGVAKRTYGASSGRTAPPSSFEPTEVVHKQKSRALSARSSGPSLHQPHQGFHTILGSTRA